jgi:nucleotide-binding universal stress UspA family protein
VGNKILLAFDGSPVAMQAVNLVGSLLGSSDYKVCLLHVIRGSTEAAPDYHGIFSPRQYMEGASIDIVSRFDDAKTALVQSGFQENKISTKMVVGVQSRAAAIVKEAKGEDYGTIVLGRRGLSQVRTFFIGRVTNKVIHMARDRTVWVMR